MGNPRTLQARHYYTFGMEMSQLNNGTTDNKYQYNGKEIQDDFGLYWYDYGARFYDPMIGRWHTPDPMADDSLNISYSPYNYCINNPILLVDPDGMDWYYYKDKGGNEHYKYQDGSDAYKDDDGNEYQNIGSTVSININDDVYLNAFQNLTMKSYGEAVNLKSKILNDKGLLINYIKDGSDLSMQGRVELFGSYVSKKIGEDGTKVVLGTLAVPGVIIAGGELVGAVAYNELAVALWRYKNGGGGLNLLKEGKSIYRLDWHKFKTGGKMVNRPHIDIPGKVKHWPW